MAKILLIEAHPLMRPAIHDLLELAGHTVVEADQGEKALQWLAEAKQEEIDLVLTNADLDDINGEALIQKVRTLCTAETLPILAFTVKPDSNIQTTAKDAGADTVLMPPLTADTLYKAIGQLLPKEH
ncbi:MAG: response regulator [Chloroflexi bacterium]|jgi:two-component system chemotaxis response regulator CheY|nr:response regulator [Chloroflexota bacterium]